MKNTILTLMAKFPLLEILSKQLLISNKIRNILKKKFINADSLEENLCCKEDYIKAIEKLPINKGDILLVHSSTDQLTRMGISPIWMIEYLITRIGNEGTLVIPAFPMYPQKNAECLCYDVKKTPCWTGMLPNIFLRLPGVIRSEFPYNTLAAKGPKASSLMENNLIDHLSFGENSAWAKCINNHAKVLFLGTPAFHTTTISHIPEDLLGENWPIKEFHREQRFLIKNGDTDKKYTAFIRDERWSKLILSHYRTLLLKKKGLITEEYINGVCLGFIQDSKKVVDLLSDMALKGKTIYHVPKKNRK